MKVLFDYQAFDMQTHGGVSRCFTELMTHFPKDVKAKLSVVETENEHLLQIGYPKIGQLYDEFIINREFPLKGRLFDIYYNKLKHYHYGWDENRNYSIELLKRGNYDVFHPTFFDDYFLDYIQGKPFVVTIHDMIPELFPQYFKRDNKQIIGKKKLVPFASAIIVVSERTKKDVVEILGVPEEKVHVVYHGISNDLVPNAESTLFPFEYILYVGDRFGYKNFTRFVEEVSKFIKKHKDVKVVCTGRPFSPEETDLLKACGVFENFIQHFVKDNHEFYNIYHNAITFVYPSLYEGFGIPILEAYQAQTPVMLNDASCFREIAGDAGVFFKMDENTSDFVDVLEGVYSMKSSEREELINKQNARLSQFSWNKSAKQLADIYKSII